MPCARVRVCEHDIYVLSEGCVCVLSGAACVLGKVWLSRIDERAGKMAAVSRASSSRSAVEQRMIGECGARGGSDDER